MNDERDYLEWIRLSIRHREEELELLRKLESDAEDAIMPESGDSFSQWRGSLAQPEDASTEERTSTVSTFPEVPPSQGGSVPTESRALTASAVTPTPSEHAGKEAFERTTSDTFEPSLPEVEDGLDHDAADDEPSTLLNENPEQESAISFVLLMEQDGHWVGFPWHEVDRVALTEEIPIGSGHRFRFSLRNLLAERVEHREESWDQRPTDSEPFAILWKRDHALSLLCCRRFGGITSVRAALDRGVEWMVRPPRPGEGREPRIVRLSDVVPMDTPSVVTATDTPGAGVTRGLASNGVRRRLRVLLAVPYLPVRVALSRSFLRADWEVTEESDPLRVHEALKDQEYDALFLNLAVPLDPSLSELLEEERFADLPLIVIGSRFQRPGENTPKRLADAPRLQFPFQDDDIGRIVESLGNH